MTPDLDTPLWLLGVLALVAWLAWAVVFRRDLQAIRLRRLARRRLRRAQRLRARRVRAAARDRRRLRLVDDAAARSAGHRLDARDGGHSASVHPQQGHDDRSRVRPLQAVAGRQLDLDDAELVALARWLDHSDLKHAVRLDPGATIGAFDKVRRAAAEAVLADMAERRG